MKHLSIFLLVLFLISGNLISQENTNYPQKRKIAEENVEFIKKNLTEKTSDKKDADRLYPLEEMNVTLTDSMVKQLGIIHKMYEANKMKKKPETKLPSSTIEKKNDKSSLDSKSKSLPSNIRMAAEFEEMQAVLVSIPSYAFASYNGSEVQLYTNHEDFNYYREYIAYMLGINAPAEVHFAPGKGVFWPFIQFYPNYQNFNEIFIYEQDEITWVPDLGIFSTENPNIIDHTIGDIWGKLIYEIHKECDVWIRLTGKEDYEDYMFEYFAERGFDIDRTKCKTFSNGTEDAFWVRDWGPFGVYYDDENNQRKLGFMDSKYYTGRQFDDEFPKTIFQEQSYNYWDLDVKMEGGNIMNDGLSYGTYGDVIYGANTVNYGQFYWNETDQKWYIESRTPITQSQLDARMKEHLGFDDIILVESLDYDGGTGHIDLWIKQFDEETMLIANLPEDRYGNGVFTDYEKIQRNREKLNNLRTVYGTKYRFLNAPMPRQDDNSEMPTDSLQYNSDPRGYLNGLVVNKAYIYPSFSKPGDANWVTDSTNNEILKSLLPGYNLIPIDSRYLTPLGGAIHCITMQIPKDAADVVTISHAPIRGNVENTGNFELAAELISKAETNKMVIHWKKTYEANWKKVEMTTSDNTTFEGAINYGYFTANDTVQYYIAAQKDDEILKYAPITAPSGYYTFHFGEDGPKVNIDQLYGYNPNSSAIASIYPNPVVDYMNVIFENENNGNVKIDIMNANGQILSTPVNKNFNKGVFTIDITGFNLPQGMYFLKMTAGENTSVKSFVIK